MTHERLVQIFQNYIENDYEASSCAYIRDALEEVATQDEIEELGFGWIYDGDEDEENE